MSAYWVLVADSVKARIFRRLKKFSPLEEIETLVHPEARLQRQDLVSDRPGQVQESRTPGESANEEPTDPKEYEAQSFARELARRIQNGRVAGEFQHLVIIADPHFLGLLRKAVDPESHKTIAAALARNVTRESVERITQTADSAFD